MMITRKHLHRRTFLRGLGTAVTLNGTVLRPTGIITGGPAGSAGLVLEFERDVLAGAGVWRGAGIRARRQFLALSALLPLTTVTAFTFARHGDFDPRYAVVGAAGYLGLLAAGLCALRPRFLALTAGSCLVGSWLWAAHLYFTDPAYQRQDFRSAASALMADETPPPMAPADIIWVSMAKGKTSAMAAKGSMPSRPI